MKGKLILFLADRLRKGKFRQSIAGFTLLELLASMMIVSVIIFTILGLVVDLMTADQRETALTETQQEMQRAIDYISSEVRESVYIYDNPNRVFNHVIPPANSIPVLAFWKLKNLPQACNAINEDGEDECDLLRLGGRTYSLVVYFLSEANNNNIWRGQARITRYELNKFNADGTDTIDGYRSPIGPGVDFESWPGNNPLPRPVVTTDVLVDFVDATRIGAGVPDVTCPADYVLTPPANFANDIRSFYACVRANPAGSNAALNQDALIFLKGNAFGKTGVSSQNAFLPVLQTQVLRRGVFQKQPD